MSANEALFRKNVERWKLFYPQYAIYIETLNKKNIEISFNQDNSINLKTFIKNEIVYYHALSNPLQEAQRWFDSLNLKGKYGLIVFGIGLGYIYKAAKEWLRANPLHELIFIEPDMGVIAALFETQEGEDILSHPQVWLAPIDPNGSMEIYPSTFTLNAYLYTALPFYERLIFPFVQLCKSNLALRFKLKFDNLLEFIDHGINFCSNYYRNLFLLPQAYLGDSLRNKFKDIPAIICGAGPSLAKSLPFLKTVRDKALIFGGGTAMNALNAESFLPHFGVGIDPNPAQFTRLIMNQAFEIPYFYRNRMSNEAASFIHGPRLYLSGSIGYALSSYFERKLDIENHTIAEGHNVINFSLSIALALGCNPLIFAGVDLAYTNGLSYSPGILNHPLHIRKDFFGTKTAYDDLIQQKDIYGQPVLTLWKWVAESLWFSQVVEENPQVKFYNATQGGIGFRGIPTINLEKLSESILRKSYDFESQIHVFMMEAEMPAKVNKAFISEALKEMLQSLKKCEKLAEVLYKSLTETMHRNELYSDVNPSSPSDHEINQRKDFEEEIAYKYILMTFGQEYESIYKHDYMRLKVDEPLLSKKEFMAKKQKLDQGKLLFQWETAKDHIKLIETVLNENTSKEVSSKLTLKNEEYESLETAHPQEIYSFEKGELILFDPLSHLDFREKFYPEPRETTTIYYDNGLLQHQEYALNEKRHGPSLYYSKEGKLLSNQWFLHGSREGKGEYYYPDGKLAHVNRFKHNKYDGIQIYFFPSGSLKSVLRYKNGLLDGEIKLYYTSGQMARQISFENGKRTGFDRLWNEYGVLIIEAEFDKDLPIGIARQWHPSGVLAKEVLFTKDSSLYEVQHWDQQGAPIAAPINSKHDFFDELTKQSITLTETLSEVVNQVKAVLPAMNNRSEEIPNESQMLSNEMRALQEQLSQLNKITNNLKFESGLDPSNPQEAIWKTPHMREEMEEQIKKMNEKVSQDINILKKSLNEALKMIQKPLKTNNDHE